MFPMLMLMLACTGDTTESGGISGTVETADYAAEVDNTVAFGFHTDGVGYFYLPSNPDAVCDDVVAYLTHSSSSEPYDPTQVWLEGTCVLNVKLAGYEGGDFSFTGEENYLDGFWNMNCAMGDGEFVYETRNGYTDYFWSNNVWNGGPSVHETSAEETEEEVSYSVTTEMTAWEGNYSDELTGGDVPMEGEVSGTVTVEWCPELYQTGLLGR